MKLEKWFEIERECKFLTDRQARIVLWALLSHIKAYGDDKIKESLGNMVESVKKLGE